MSLTTTKQRFKLIYRLLFWQSIAAIASAVIVLWAAGQLAAKSWLFGTYSVILPHLVFTWYVFRFRGDLEPQRVLQSIYRGETLKFILMALLIIAVLKHAVVIHWLYFGGLVFTLILLALLPLLINYDNWD